MGINEILIINLMELRRARKSLLNQRRKQHLNSREKERRATINQLYPQNSNYNKPQINKYHLNIQRAYKKYDTLNQGYKLGQIKNHTDFSEDSSDKLCQNKKDPSSGLNKLRHFQNKAQINRVEKELLKRQSKKQIRMSKTWRKYEKTINTSYLATYRNFLKERIEDFDNDSEEEEKEESKSSQNHDFEEFKDIQYSKQLKKHPKILKYTKEKILQKQRFFQSQSKQKRKTQSLVEMNALKNEQLLEHYDRVLKRAEYDKKQKKVDMNKANIIVEGKISKILNKKNLFRLPDKVLKNNRCQKFVNEQSTIFLQQKNNKISKDNKNKMKQKFNELILELSKSQLNLSPSDQAQRIKQSMKESLQKSKTFFVAQPRKKYQTIQIQLPQAISEQL